MAAFVGVFAFQIKDLNETNERRNIELAAKQEEYEKESERTQQLEEQRIYVQTKKHVEEEAKKLGFVYPDEIVLKPAQKE